MTVPQLMPWIGAPPPSPTPLSPLISPVDESVVSQMIESNAKVIDAAVKHAHEAFLSTRTRPPPSASSGSWPPPTPSTRSRASWCARSFASSASRGAPRPSRPSGWGFHRACAAQVPHIKGEVLPLDVTPPGAGRFGFTVRVPYGVVAAVTPFNGPANLLIQKVAPALAVGNSMVVKPSPPGTEVALLIAEAMKKAGVPDGLFNVVPGGRDTASCSPPIRWSRSSPSPAARWPGRSSPAPPARRNSSASSAPTPPTSCADADLTDAATRIAGAAFEASGQQCISAQRVIVERPCYDRFLGCSSPPPRSSRSATRRPPTPTSARW